MSLHQVHPNRSRVSVGISMGQGTDLIITEDDKLAVIDYSNSLIELGYITNERIDEIQGYLDRLRCHAMTE